MNLLIFGLSLKLRKDVVNDYLAQVLDDVLRGEAWNFVQLPLGTVLSETEDIKKAG